MNTLSLQIKNANSIIDCVPVIHGRCIFAQEVRKIFLQKSYQCIAIELPNSLKNSVIEAVQKLPTISAVLYLESYKNLEKQYCYVPIEPGEGIMEAIRLGLEERLPTEFIDMEMEVYEPYSPALPDEYAVGHLGLESYYQAVLPYLIPAPPNSAQDMREIFMAEKLRKLTAQFKSILFVCGLAHWEGVRRHFQLQTPFIFPEEQYEYDCEIRPVHTDSIYLLTGEIPYLTFLYEKHRSSLELTPYDKGDGLKELYLESRKEYCRDIPEEHERLTPGALQTMLTYLRNLCLVKNYLTPSLYDLIVAAQGVGGSGYAARVVEMAKFYPYQDPTAESAIRIGVDKGYTEELGEFDLKNRLPGPPFSLKNIKLERRPKLEKQIKWKRHWGNHSECSWPEEDERIENFTKYVKMRALSLVSEDLSRVEKFTTSIKDGLDIRETIRQWHTQDIYVKEMPPARGDVGAVIFIFDKNFDKYTWRTTWQAEHQNESTLCFYATNHCDDIIGPGISRAFYGGALFIFPPITIEDIWKSSIYDFTQNPIERLVAAAATYSRSKFIAYIGSDRPDLSCRNIARRLQKHLIFLPLSGFSTYTLRKLRKFHVLQGREIRSYAQKYIC